MSQKCTIFHVKDQPYTKADGTVVSYPEVTLFQHGTPLENGEIGLPIYKFKLSSQTAAKFKSTPLKDGHPVVADCIFITRQRSYGSKTTTDVILQDFSPTGDNK